MEDRTSLESDQHQKTPQRHSSITEEPMSTSSEYDQHQRYSETPQPQRSITEDNMRTSLESDQHQKTPQRHSSITEEPMSNFNLQRYKDMRANQRAAWISLDKSNKEMDEFVEELLRSRQSSCQRCEQQTQEHKQEIVKITENKEKLAEELQKARAALEDKDKELKSLKDRVAKFLSKAPKPDNVENMNSPVNTSRLKEMYAMMKFESSQMQDLELTKEHIKEVLQKAAEEVESMKRPIDDMFREEGSNPQVKKFRQTALENLQLALFHSSSRKQDAYKAKFPNAPEETEELDLVSECYRLGRLMALHSPSLQDRLDWTQVNDGDLFPVFK